MNENEASSPLFDLVHAAIATGESADLGPQTRPDAKAIPDLRSGLDAVFAGRRLPESTRNLIWAAALLWHDHLDEAHGIVQDASSGDPAFIHGILHRREPDYGNAKYWFNRVGRHAAFPLIAARVAGLVGITGSRLVSTLIPGGTWQPLKFIDLCEETALKPGGDPVKKLLREIQRIEFETLLERLCPKS